MGFGQQSISVELGELCEAPLVPFVLARWSSFPRRGPAPRCKRMDSGVDVRTSGLMCKLRK